MHYVYTEFSPKPEMRELFLCFCLLFEQKSKI